MSTPPPRFRTFVDNHPEISDAYQQLGRAIKKSGPLDDRMAQLVKIGIAVGMQHEGAVHAHTRKGLDAGCTSEEIRHAVVLATTTLGFPSMMAAMTWVDDVLEDRST
jgi:alkylhydroperoxidase/carboxymuconolactone decarboxylase family protein YurZ